ncbi:MAG: response regulator [Candidatus Aceula meridiana]|nr:response regulator [Candidatus Aceula meridiana]
MWKILVAEDDLANQQKLLEALKGVAKCTLATSGQEALDVFKKAIKSKKPFDFVLLDVTMPRMDGFEVLKALRGEEEKRKEKVKEAIVMMITAYKDSLMEKYNMGWDDFITKPIEKDILLKHMQDLEGSRV